MQIVTVEEMQALEALADRNGVSYAAQMEAAGRGVAERIRVLIEEQMATPVPALDPVVVILVGGGNNGGDGLVCARVLAEDDALHATIKVMLIKPREDQLIEALRATPAQILTLDSSAAAADTLTQWLGDATIIVDAILGTGQTLPLRANLAALLQQIGQIRAARAQTAHDLRVIAMDLPTGIEANTGLCDPAVLTADETITFAALKPAHVTYPSAAHVGEITVVPLGWPEASLHHAATALRSRIVLDHAATAQRLPRRAVDANKGTFGKALVVAGSGNYIGAAILAAESAYRVGAGLVTVATPAPNVRLLAPRLLEATWLPLTHQHGSIDESAADIVWDQFANFTALLIGPGLGQAQATASFMEVLFPLEEVLPPLPTTYPDPPFPSFETLLAQKTQQPPPEVVPPTAPPPLVIDADALNLLAQLPFWWKRLPPRTILTPHAGEMARLAGITATVGGRSPAQQVQADRLRLVEAKAAEWNCIVVLKGANTIVADPQHTEVIPFATPALARAGTGDALAGCIVGYLAQGLAPAVAAALGVYVHGQAGMFAAEHVGTTASVLASDVIAALPRSIRTLEQLAGLA